MFDNSVSHGSHILIGQLKWKPSESCLYSKDVEKLSQSNKKLYCSWVAMVRHASLLIHSSRKYPYPPPPPPAEKVFCFAPPSPPSLASYFPSTSLAIKNPPPPPRNFLNLLGGVWILSGTTQCELTYSFNCLAVVSFLSPMKLRSCSTGI